MIHHEALLDGLLVVVGTSALLSAQDEALHQLVLGHVELQHGSHLVTTLTEHRLQGLSLRNGAGETVEDDAGMLLAKAIVDGGQDRDHQVVGYQLSVVNKLLGGLAQFRAFLNLGTQHVAGRNVVQSILLNELVALGALS